MDIGGTGFDSRIGEGVTAASGGWGKWRGYGRVLERRKVAVRKGILLWLSKIREKTHNTWLSKINIG